MSETISFPGVGGGELVIVAHGAPSDPEPQQQALEALATEVAALLPGDWRVGGATLARKGALETALAGMDRPLVYPFFMAQGWFTGTELPRRLAAAGRGEARQLLPFGLDPALPGLVMQAARQGAEQAGLAPGEAGLVLAAHGSAVSRGSATATTALAREIAACGTFARVEAGYVEEAPYLAAIACGMGPSVCLPLFAQRAGHVTRDVPRALEQAGFEGPLLPPIGAHPGVPALIAAAAARAVTE
ncbi:CbiX/SirB N-terminal domain-containing protein [Acidimangrovimonas pyrenivorans]|uniref:CbiX/SirB N-terminal domain-containing protein n=1 Tax=Acidimangrovimonas pyrenivorans TaxID=2030798 RepID=A0ABV7AKR2_9RHOB